MYRTALSLSIYFLAAPVLAQDCKALHEQQLASVDRVDLTTFDRTNGQGWRVLADAGCFQEAADLIRRFQRSHGDEPSLFVHLGQMNLRLELRAEAARDFRRAVRPDGAPGDFKYNDFVLALAAYAERDRPSFDRHLSEVKKFPDNPGNKANLRLLSKISDGFELPYLTVLSSLRSDTVK